MDVLPALQIYESTIHAFVKSNVKNKNVKTLVYNSTYIKKFVITNNYILLYFRYTKVDLYCKGKNFLEFSFIINDFLIFFIVLLLIFTQNMISY